MSYYVFKKTHKFWFYKKIVISLTHPEGFESPNLWFIDMCSNMLRKKVLVLLLFVELLVLDTLGGQIFPLFFDSGQPIIAVPC